MVYSRASARFTAPFSAENGPKGARVAASEAIGAGELHGDPQRWSLKVGRLPRAAQGS